MFSPCDRNTSKSSSLRVKNSAAQAANGKKAKGGGLRDEAVRCDRRDKYVLRILGSPSEMKVKPALAMTS